MKVRNGFVSNSSSSSFCILGVTTDEINSKLNPEVEIDFYEKCSDGLEYESWISEYEEGGAVGVYPCCMVEDKTVAQNKEAVADMINNSFGTDFTKDNIGFITDGGYNG